MIGYFPAPYKDELLYSICARYSSSVKYSHRSSICLELFGESTVSVVCDLPAYLQHLAKMLPENSCYSVEQLIENHTLFPFYRPFMEPEVAKSIKAQMSQSSASGIHFKAGLAASRVSPIKYLRYCPLCVKEDIHNYGETYWRRTHQLPSAIICPVHNIYLNQSAVKRYSSQSQYQFITASDSILGSVKERYLESTPRASLILKLAQASSDLLEESFRAFGKDALLNKYLRLLVDRGLASYSLSLRAKKLETQFLKFYPSDLLSEFNCKLTKTDELTKGNWLLQLLRKHQTGAQHPLHHLLLFIFFNISPADFFNLPNEINFFGESPWQCLNPVAHHYKQSVVTDFRLGSRCRKGKPIGIFKCKCGFEFARSGPDIDPADKLRIDRMINFGEVWESELVKLWNDPSLNLSEIARRLEVDPLTVRKYAKKLKLPFERGGKSYQLLSDKNTLKESPNLNLELERDKSQWLALVKEFPESSLKSLRLRNSGLYSRLHIRAKEWLKSNLPQEGRREKINSTSVDWNERDEALSEMIQKALITLMEKPGRPARITKTAIGKEADCLSLLLNKRDKLPKTQLVLKTLIETTEEFAIRRIQWTAKMLREDHAPVTYWNLVEGACVYKLRKNLVISQILQKESSQLASK